MVFHFTKMEKKLQKMPKKVQKSLQNYMSKIKTPSPNVLFQSTSLPSSKNWIFKGCKHVKTQSFAVEQIKDHGLGHQKDDDAATLSDVDRFLFENFRSLYGQNEDEDEYENNYQRKKENINNTLQGNVKSNIGTAYMFDSPRFDLPPDLCGSNRFFTRPGLSSSLVEEARSSATLSDDMPRFSSATTTTYTTINESTSENISDDHPHVKKLGSTSSDDSIMISMYSPSPYTDFQRSMHEMIEARVCDNGNVDWDFMEELLFSYLNLNDQKSHKYILSAFVDSIIALRRSKYAKAQGRSRRVQLAGESRGSEDLQM